MEGSMIDLSKYRFESAKDDLEMAQKVLGMLEPYLEECWKTLLE